MRGARHDEAHYKGADPTGSYHVAETTIFLTEDNRSGRPSTLSRLTLDLAGVSIFSPFLLPIRDPSFSDSPDGETSVERFGRVGTPLPLHRRMSPYSLLH